MVNESHRGWTSQLDWVKLTAEPTAGGSYTVRWDLVNGDGVSNITLYWATDRNSSSVMGSGFAAHAAGQSGIAALPYDNNSFLPLVIGSAGSTPTTEFQYEMSTAGLVSGREYYVAMRLDDGYNVIWVYSDAPVRVL